LDDIQDDIYNKALEFRNKNIIGINSINEFKEHFSKNNPEFVICYSDSDIDETREELLKELKTSARCIPLEFNKNNEESNCIFT
jgi:prolyl-tRNA synthetase